MGGRNKKRNKKRNDKEKEQGKKQSEEKLHKRELDVKVGGPVNDSDSGLRKQAEGDVLGSKGRPKPLASGLGFDETDKSSEVSTGTDRDGKTAPKKRDEELYRLAVFARAGEIVEDCKRIRGETEALFQHHDKMKAQAQAPFKDA